MQVLFVCRGNVGRSQMAEAIFNKVAANSDWKAISAGTKVIDKEGRSVEGELLKDRPGAANVVAVMAELGFDVSLAQRNQLTPAMVEEADVVVSMAETDTMPEYLTTSDKVHFWSFPDPKNATLDDTRAIRDTIKTKVLELVDGLGIQK